MHTIPHLRSLHARSIQAATLFVAAITDTDLARPTPCEGWTLHHLLVHMIGQNYGFAQAVSTGDAPLAAYRGPGDPASDLAAEWHRSSAHLLAAFAQAPSGATAVLREVRPSAAFPLEAVLGMHLLDTAVHAWDVATSLGRSYRPDEEIVSAVATIAATVPAGEARTRPGAAFAPTVSPTASDAWHGTLALLGRTP